MGMRIGIYAASFFDQPAVVEVPRDDAFGALQSMIAGILRWYSFSGMEAPAVLYDEEKARDELDWAISRLSRKSIGDQVYILESFFRVRLEGTYSDPLPYRVTHRILTPEEKKRHDAVIKRIMQTTPPDLRLTNERDRKHRRAKAFGQAFRMAWRAATLAERQRLVDRIPRRFPELIEGYAVADAVRQDVPPFEPFLLWWELKKARRGCART